MKKYFIIILLILTTIFLGREFFIFNNPPFQIFAEKDYLLIRSESGKLWGYGNIKSNSAKILSQNITSYFSLGNIRNIYDLEENKEYLDKNLTIQKISRDLAYLRFKNKTFLLFGENLSDHGREKLIKSSLSLKADWHIVNKNIDLSFFPTPNQGTLYISDRKPSKKMQTKFREKNIPLISTSETGGFSLKLIRDDFHLSVRI